MDDPSQQESPARSSKDQVCDEIGRAVGSAWQRRCGVRPTSVSTEYVGDVVRCTIEPGDPAAAESEDSETVPETASLGDRSYEHEAQSAVRRLTGRTVKGFVAKEGKGPSGVTNAFILERVRVKY